MRVIGPVKGPTGPPLKVLQSAMTWCLRIQLLTIEDRFGTSCDNNLLCYGRVPFMVWRSESTTHCITRPQMQSMLSPAARRDPAATASGPFQPALLYGHDWVTARRRVDSLRNSGSRESKPDFARFYTCHDKEKDIVLHDASRRSHKE